jgi:hypothetical protein
MSAWTRIQHIEVPSAQANIEFTSIAQTYTDLVIMISARSNHAGSFADIRVGPNGSTSNLTIRRLFGTGSAATSDNPATDLMIGNADGSTASTFNNFMVYIPNYTSSNAKSISADYVAENNATLGYAGISAGLWNPSPQAAITSITLSWNAGNFMTNSSATLYGITKGSSGGVTVS